MITLTRLSGQRFALNPDLTERAEAMPDTVIPLVNSAKHVVLETLDEVVHLVLDYQGSIIALAPHNELPPVRQDDVSTHAPTLQVVTPSGVER